MDRASVRASRARLAARIVCTCLGIAAIVLAQRDLGAAPHSPLRTFWIARAALDEIESIRRAATTAAAGGVDAVMVPIALPSEPAQAFDGVREMLREVRERGLRAHAWIDVTRAAAIGELPSSRDHVLYRHPEWLMVPRELAAELMRVDVRSPAYLGRLTRWTRQNAARIDGLYVSPLAPDATSYIVDAISQAVRRYNVDGVFLDAIGFPGTDFDYSRHAMEIFRNETRSQLTADERARLDEIELIDPFGYPEEFPDRWRSFRQTRVTQLMARLRKVIAAVNPSLVVSVGLSAEPDNALSHSFQDWSGWMSSGFVDGIGRRSGATGTIVFTADGLSASVALPSTVQTNGAAAIP